MFLEIKDEKIVNLAHEKRDGYIEIDDNEISLSLVWFYRYKDGNLVLDKDLYQKHLLEVDYNNKIEQLKQYLFETDYVVIKIMEGASKQEDYQEILYKRNEVRKEINRLQSLI